MAKFQSDYAKGLRPAPIACGAEVVAVRAEITPTAAAAGDIFDMIPIPEDHVLVDLIMDSEDIDSNGAPTITLSAAFLNSGGTDIDVTANVNGDGAAFIVASTIAQAGGMARPTTKSLWKALPRSSTPSGTTPTNNQLRNLGIKVVAASATFASGKVGLTAIYRAAHYGG